jgi:hypothetical protein
MRLVAIEIETPGHALACRFAEQLDVQGTCVPIGVVKTGGASGNDKVRASATRLRGGELRVDLAGGLHRHVKKPRIGWCRNLRRHTKSWPTWSAARTALL